MEPTPTKKYVTKRDGTKAEIKQVRIKERLQGLCEGLNMDYINLDVVTKKVYAGIYSGKYSNINRYLFSSFLLIFRFICCRYSDIITRHPVS